MPQDQTAKDTIRIQQAAKIMRALIGTFGEPIVLDALASVVEAPNGKAYLEAAAAFSRAANEQSPASLPGPEHVLI